MITFISSFRQQPLVNSRRMLEKVHNTIPPVLLPWLQDRGSFMKRVRRHHLKPEIHVLQEKWQLPLEDEATVLAIAPRRYVFSREVVIHQQDRTLLFARAVIPAFTLTGPERQLMHLGKRALGSLLFAYPDIKRSAFEMKTYQLSHYSSEALWGRRSIFYYQGKLLLLSEVFLPGLINIL
jgi:chorismate--pyruvate lyase